MKNDIDRTCVLAYALFATATAILLLSGSFAHAWSGNLLSNSSFEQGNAYWDAYSFPTAYAVQQNPHSGAWAMRVGTGEGGRAQLVPRLRPGATYKVAAWAMVSTPGEAGYIGIECYDMAGTQYVDGFTVSSTSYAYYEKEITLPSTLDSYAVVYIWKNSGPGYLYADEVCLYGPDVSYSAGNTTYYVDALSGSDSYAGTSPSLAWRTLGKVNSVVFGPDDAILFRVGCAWSGQLAPLGSGAEGRPITVDCYGSGPKPIINGGAVRPDAVHLYNQEHWRIRNLEVTNTAPQRRPHMTGVRVEIRDFGTAHQVYLRDLYIHDVNGSNVKGEGDSGILWFNGGNVIPSRFDGLRIEDCYLLRTDRNGIAAWTDFWTRDNWYPSLHVVIRGNTLEDIGGDGIVPIGCEGALVEHNVLNGGRTRAGDYAAGMWPWSCDNSVFQFNEAYGMVGTLDGEGFDCDYNSHDTIMQYNYSHDNEGGFMLICSDGSYSFNDGSIVRYNISQNDHTRTFHLPGNCTNTYIYNNTIYIGEGVYCDPIVHSSWYGYADGTHCYNNIFYNLGTGDYYFEASTNNVFDYNVFYGNHPSGEPADAHKLTSDPMLAAPGGAGIGRETCDAYHLLPDSPCIDSGMEVADNGGLDFFGNPVPYGLASDRGAHEYTLIPPQVLLEVHPNERGQGPPSISLNTGAPFWTWPTPSGAGAYTWKNYRFGGSSSLWIQVCAQNYAAFQNKPKNGFGDQDTLMLVVDGVVTPSDVWGIQSGTPGQAQWKGDVDWGKRVSLEFCVTGLAPGLHTLRLTASMCPIVWWVKVHDLEQRYAP